MRPHSTLYVSSYYYICVLILLYMRPHTTIYVSSFYYICVLILLYMCPHTTIYESATGQLLCAAAWPRYRKDIRVACSRGQYTEKIYREARSAMLCPHATTSWSMLSHAVSSCYYFMFIHYMCPHTTMYVSSYSLCHGAASTRGGVADIQNRMLAKAEGRPPEVFFFHLFFPPFFFNFFCCQPIFRSRPYTFSVLPSSL